MIAFVSEPDIVPALQMAVERRELLLLFQPKIAATTGDMVGVEALMRWRSPQLGLQLPDTFIPLAETCGIIDEITEWGLRETLRHWRIWCEQGIRTNVAFNVSPSTLRDVRFPDFLLRLCMAEGVPCEQLTIEVTENSRQPIMRLLEPLTRIRIKGMHLEIDEFGTGYSSLLHLRQLPFSGLKIDMAFIRDAARDPEARLIVKSIIDLAHGLGLTATAEGVEDERTFRLLQELGCDHVQGNLIASPLQPSDIVPWLLRCGQDWREICTTPSEQAASLRTD
jgi:EAL domain-containing protein (putative c-di-GMP-specific phosphodiesterase class I)